MNFLKKKKGVQKIIITIIFLILFNFIVPTYSHAGVGGVLSAPVVGLLCVLADSFNCMMANFMVESQNVFSVYPDKDSDDAKKYIEENKYYDDDALPTVLIDPEDFLGDYGIPILKYTPSQIFSGKLPSLDVNFFREDVPNIEDEPKSIVAHLRGIVSSWYVALRNLAVVGLLSVLIYLGIRMVITSSNAEKAKYKQNILDWLVAMCLVFFLHYIMAFTMTMTEAITDMIANDDVNGNEIYIGILGSAPTSRPADSPNIITQEEAQSYKAMIDKDESFATTLMGAARLQCEYEDGGKKWSYLILYLALTIYTVMFTITYIKRLINMVFLTIIAPLVALTYPLDKAGDSKAQAFSFWLKEYIYNALIQPVHLLLYTILVTSALSLAATNMIYAIIALAFILPAEKILKQMFNFRNTTGQGLGGFAGGMVAKSLLDSVAKGGKSKQANANKNNNKVRTANTPVPRDPDAPRGATALAGQTSLVSGSPRLSQTRANLPQGTNGAPEQGIRGVNTNNIGTNGRMLTDNERQQRENLQTMVDNPDTTNEDRAQYQRQLDYYNRLENGGRMLTDSERLQRENLQTMIDNPDTTDEDRAQYQRQLDYYNRIEDGIVTPNDDNSFVDMSGVRSENSNGNDIYASIPRAGADIEHSNGNGIDASIPRTGADIEHSGVNATAGTLEQSRAIRTQSSYENSLDEGRQQRGGIIGGIKNVAGKVYRNAGGASGIAKSATKGIARGSVRAAAMAGGIAIGTAAGIVSDDLDKIGQYAIGGAMAGRAIGNNAANRVEGIAESAQGVMDTFNQGRYSADEYDRRILVKKEKEFKRDYINRQYFQHNFKDKTDAQLDDIMDRAAAFNRNGLKDLDRIKDAIKLEDGLRERAREIQGGADPTQEQITMAHNEALTLAKIRGDLGEAGFSDYKRVESRKAALKKQLTNNGMNEEAAKQRTNDSFDFMEKMLNT